MADAALACGYQYIAITDHSKNLAMTNGLDEKRALEQIKQVRAVDREMEGRIRVFTGIEADILADGAIDSTTKCLRNWTWSSPASTPALSSPARR